MRKILIIMVTCITSFNAFSASYDCRPQTESARDAATLELANGKYLICGHKGIDGCNDGAVVYSDKEEVFYKCDSSGRNKWELYDVFESKSCLNDFKLTDYDDYKLFNGFFIFFSTVNGSAQISNSCEAIVGYMETHCRVSGGVWHDNRCDCPEDTMRHVGKFDVCKCECKDGLEYNEYDKKCYPKVSKVEDKPAEQKQPAKQEKVEEPVEEVVDNKTGAKTTVKYNYQQCEKDNDCKNMNNTVRPYLHSTAWHCAWQSADVRVCTATACESGWTPKDGYCQEDKTPAPTNTQNSTTGSTVQQVGQAGTTTVSKTTVKKTCPDPDNMDSNCKCVVAETTERGGRCVCIDGDKEIKNGKCEYTAEYISKIESDLDEKYASLMATIGGFEKNVWRDADGNFNTSRLVSDSVAGVVLGTVGGIVTSSLVKKAQVKKGFEDIGCYIGGQSVAGYGDEFMVGR